MQIILTILFIIAALWLWSKSNQKKYAQKEGSNSNMALFKTQEEKQQAQNNRIYQAMVRYGVDDLSDPKDMQAIQNIVNSLAGSSLMEVGSLMAGNEAIMNRVNAQYSKAIFEQNFIIIRQLERLNRNLETQTSPEG